MSFRSLRQYCWVIETQVHFSWISKKKKKNTWVFVFSFNCTRIFQLAIHTSMEALAKRKRKCKAECYINLLLRNRKAKILRKFILTPNKLTQSIQAPNTQQSCNTKLHFLGKRVNNHPITLVSSNADSRWEILLLKSWLIRAIQQPLKT